MAKTRQKRAAKKTQKVVKVSTPPKPKPKWDEPDQLLKLWTKTRNGLMRESEMQNLHAKTAAAESVATCQIKMKLLARDAMMGNGIADEQRTLPSLASSIKRGLEILQVCAVKEDDDDEL